MLTVLLDTHVWIWAEECPEKLGRSAKKMIESEDIRLIISPISSLELAQLLHKKRIVLKKPLSDWIRLSLENLKAGSAEFSHKIAIHSYELEELHPDPADRVLISTARALSAKLMTADRRILEWGRVECVDAAA